MKVVGPFINIASLIFLKVISPPNVFTVIKSSFFDKKFDATHKDADPPVSYTHLTLPTMRTV